MTIKTKTQYRKKDFAFDTMSVGECKLGVLVEFIVWLVCLMAGAEFSFLFNGHNDQTPAKNKKDQIFESCLNWLVELYKEKDLISSLQMWALRAA